MKSNELSNIEINKTLSRLKNYHGCFMRDELNYSNFNDNGFYIINLDKSTNDGTHWTCIYKDVKIYYFDPFGFVAPKEVEKIIKPYIYSNIQCQDINSTSCGYFCIAFCLYMNDKEKEGCDPLESFNDFINMFNSLYNIFNNEQTLYKLLKSYNVVV